ncbi:reprolysin-like metallopeptidase [Capnocytophaga catalasegens]|uniref:Peptidase M12B domain-containing protein n=1 Tax=Capnocytophaga catalasegens TaxID=1004260 RepID=A0AAV5AUH5_9FLAO|nr:gliding motility-associated C-terminal domain-containing protein [Capnocytophaga catalasegens]GIZ14099.1 hypothetical protein RCZ03_01000 [Capnocytophaga catalasegens]GJM49097.1 hypothetical protein RCZ15_00730 [Capnocytophaga catalasegens]GJM52358.1 hypothetical protein RCZ16_06760 [Capnocytophaga catalasegens]
MYFFKKNTTKSILLLLILFINCSISSAQEIVLPISSKTIINIFNTGEKNIKWEFPIDNSNEISLVWSEKQTSFSVQNIKTFVGYENDTFRATLSFQNDQISGNLMLSDREITLFTNPQGSISITSSHLHNAHCGNCVSNECSISPPASIRFQSGIETPLQLSEFTTNQSKSLADDVLRVYRLAMPITYEYYTSKFRNNLLDVQLFWANTEISLNEIYLRDLAVKFQVVNNEKLVITTIDDPINNANFRKNAREIILNSTENINKLITANDYDIGIVIGKNSQLQEFPDGTPQGGLLGLAGVGAGYISSFKAQGIAIASTLTIAHEIGHMLGAQHTFSEGGDGSVKTEPKEGQSIMSYGTPANFFSLVSIFEHIKPLLARMPYYSDNARKNLVGIPFYNDNFYYNNASYGIKTGNKAPSLNKSNLKTKYTLPQNTFFQFQMKATDPENQKLYYLAHQADIKSLDTNEASNAVFLTQPASVKNRSCFQTEYEPNLINFYKLNEELYTERAFSTPTQTGTFTFWLGVRDSDLDPNYTERTNRATTYDMMQTSVEIKQGIPFVLTNEFAQSYKAGQKLNLKWNVDANSFGSHSNVRILLSDDFGDTFRYVLVDKTENDGTCEIVFPSDISIGTTKIKSPFSATDTFDIPAGVIKIEVIDHIAYAISHTRPFSAKRRLSSIETQIIGGFTLEKSEITFQNTPEREITVFCHQIPEKATVTAISTCNANTSPNISYKETNVQSQCKQHTLIREWTATDLCGNTAIFQQLIHIIPASEPLVFIGNLPQNIVVSCNNIPLPATYLATKGGCDAVQITYEEQKDSNTSCKETYTITRYWTATDQCGNKATHTQTIMVLPEIKIYNAVSKNYNTNYFKIEGLEAYTDTHVLIFDQMGLRVYETYNYGVNGNVFKGISNVKGFSQGKKVPNGTYFYILSYKDFQKQSYRKSGFLYVGGD